MAQATAAFSVPASQAAWTFKSTVSTEHRTCPPFYVCVLMESWSATSSWLLVHVCAFPQCKFLVASGFCAPTVMMRCDVLTVQTYKIVHH